MQTYWCRVSGIQNRYPSIDLFQTGDDIFCFAIQSLNEDDVTTFINNLFANEENMNIDFIECRKWKQYKDFCSTEEGNSRFTMSEKFLNDVIDNVYGIKHTTVF